MKISVIGLGYVGAVTAACLAKAGHDVTGVDVSPVKVDQLNRGHSPIVEEEIGELIAKAVSEQKLRATCDIGLGVAVADLVIVCVGTPSARNGALDTSYVQKVCEQIGCEIKNRTSPVTIVVRSTLLPGTTRKFVLPIIEKYAEAGPGKKYEVVFHPEFLREGSSVKDFYDPPKIIVGERVLGAADTLLQLYTGFEAPLFRVDYETAESVKYCDNLFHALKITFANEVGHFCREQNINSRKVMDIFCADTKLNLSAKYLRPGFAFGGSCLPKDLRAFLYAARVNDVPVPMLEQVLASNKQQIDRVLEEILAAGVRRVGFHGLAFKPGTDDLRESPHVTLAELLNGKGMELKIFDNFVQVSRLVGRNLAFIDQSLPHLAALLVNKQSDLETCEMILVAHPAPADTIEKWLAMGILVYDLTGIADPPQHKNFRCVN